MSAATPNTAQAVIRIMCPKLSCQRVLAVPATARGKLVRCRGCGTTIRIPQVKSGSRDDSAKAPPSPPAKG